MYSTYFFPRSLLPCRFQLGPLYCSGEEEEQEADSCLALWRAGDTMGGFRMVRGRGDSFPKVLIPLMILPSLLLFTSTTSFCSPGSIL